MGERREDLVQFRELRVLSPVQLHVRLFQRRKRRAGIRRGHLHRALAELVLAHARGQMDPVGGESVGLLHIPAGPVSGSAEDILRRHLHRREYELERGTVLPQLPEQAAEVQRVLPGLVGQPRDADVAMPGPLAVGLIGKQRIISIFHVAPFARPCQMVGDQHALVGSVTRTQVEQRETEAAGHHRVRAQLALKRRPVDAGGAFHIAQADGVLGSQVIGEPGFPVGEAEGQGRLVAEIDPIEDVVQIAFAERNNPRSALLLAHRSFKKPAGVRSAGFSRP